MASLASTSVSMTGGEISSSGVTILNPDGTHLLRQAVRHTAGGFIDKRLLGTTGTYHPGGPGSTNTGNMTLNLFNVGNVSATITAGGTTRSRSPLGPERRSHFQRVTATREFDCQRRDGCGHHRYTVRETGWHYVSFRKFGTSGGFIEIPYLPTAGTYTIFVDPPGANTGNISLTLNDATDVTNTITPGGGAVVIANTIPGQNARLTFSGTSGQRIAVNAATNFSVCWTLAIVKPDGTNLTSVFNCGNTTFIDPQQLPTTGTYTILVDPSAPASVRRQFGLRRTD